MILYVLKTDVLFFVGLAIDRCRQPNEISSIQNECILKQFILFESELGF